MAPLPMLSIRSRKNCSSYSDDTETFTVSKSLTLEGQKKRLLQAALTAMREAA
jgi:intracellular multiplication protein IcmO